MVSTSGGTTIAGWFIVENPNLKWMISRGTPMYGEARLAESFGAVEEPRCRGLDERMWRNEKDPTVESQQIGI